VNAESAARSLHVLYLIARREFLTRVRTRFFIFGTALMVVVLAGYVLVQVLVVNTSTSTPLKVGLAGSAQVLSPALRAQASLAGTNIRVSRVVQSRGESEVRDGDLDAVVSGPPSSPEVLVKDRANPELLNLLTALVRQEALSSQLSAAGLDPVAVDVMSAVLRQQAAEGIPVMFSSHQLELVERLCDRVGIIRSGRLVACGAVDELRRGGPDRFWVDAPRAPAGWARPLPDVKVVRTEGSRTLVELGPGADEQAVLKAALDTGPVLEFRRDVPSLADLFRHAVAEKKVA